MVADQVDVLEQRFRMLSVFECKKPGNSLAKSKIGPHITDETTTSGTMHP